MQAQQVANEALGTANKALVLIEQHQADCNRREERRERREREEREDAILHRKEVKESLDNLRDGMGDLGRQIGHQDRANMRWVLGLAGMIITFLLALVGYLLVNGAPWWLRSELPLP